MDLALIGLGQMWMNMTTRLLQGNHRIVAYDLNKAAVKAFEKAGAEIDGSHTLRLFLYGIQKGIK
jgi:6-phosphogluconate dehydrogenase (decarboxylating)